MRGFVRSSPEAKDQGRHELLLCIARLHILLMMQQLTLDIPGQILG